MGAQGTRWGIRKFGTVDGTYLVPSMLKPQGRSNPLLIGSGEGLSFDKCKAPPLLKHFTSNQTNPSLRRFESR